MIKYRVSFDFEILEKHFPRDDDGTWRFAFELHKLALYNVLRGQSVKDGIINSFDGIYLYTTDRPTNEQFFELWGTGVFLEEINRRQEVKNQIVSKLADELNEIVRHEEFDDISYRLYDMISIVKEW